MRILTALGTRFYNSPILSETLAPPQIAMNGCFGLSTATPQNLISFSIQKPAAVCYLLEDIHTLEACLRWARLKATLNKQSPKLAQVLPSTGSLPDSFLPDWSYNRSFSIQKSSPTFNFAIASTHSLPRSAEYNSTGFYWHTLRRSDTGLQDCFALSSSVLTRHRWDSRIALPPWYMTYWMVGHAATIRLTTPITPSLIGTLKDSRIQTFLSLTSKSETINLAQRYDLLLFPKDDAYIKLTIHISFNKAQATLIKAPFNGLTQKSGGK